MEDSVGGSFSRMRGVRMNAADLVVLALLLDLDFGNVPSFEKKKEGPHVSFHNSYCHTS